MPTAERPAVYTIPPHVAFVDALARGLLDLAGGDTLVLARARVFLPNRRAVRALTDAFVRLAGGGLLLPRMTPVGDIDGGLDSEAGFDLARPFDPCERRLRLAQLVRRGAQKRGDAVTAVEALRLGDALASALDALTAEEVPADALETLELDGLAHHFEVTLAHFRSVRTHWPAVLAATGTIDPVARRNTVLDALADEWRAAPPPGLVVAAGITVAPPPLARLLGVVARLPRGMVVLPGLDTAMPEAEWEAIRLDGDGDEAHPQFALKRLLDRMSVGRGEAVEWPATTDADGPKARTRAVARAMSLAAFTGDWRAGVAADAFAGIRTVVAPTAEEEAQVVALALRRVLETPGRTGALVTPDRGLARRVAAHLSRWGVAIDDSAGQPLTATPPGTLLIALAEAAVEHFAPVALLAVLKHPLVRRGDDRPAWLAEVRRLDLDLRGVRPAPGLSGVADAVRTGDAARERRRGSPLLPWWDGVAALLAPLADAFGHPACDLADVVAVLRDTAFALAGEELWRGPAGRGLADIVAALTAHGGHLEPFEPADAPPLLAAFLRDVPVRPAYSRHPRLAVYGTLEARLQRADLVVLGGLNEGSWPGVLAPDPWLPPRVRSLLGLGGPQRSIGLAAHDFVEGLGAPEVLLTRARRDDNAPTVASRLWLRLAALAGPALAGDDELLGWARALDRPANSLPAARPEPAPPAASRPRRLSVTGAELLRADPFSFYARNLLRLDPLDALDEDPGAAERGIDLHQVLETWTRDGGNLAAIGEAMLRSKWLQHPLMQALWAPRVRRALAWVEAEMEAWQDMGWSGARAEAGGVLELENGIMLRGRADRIDRNAAGELAIIDYKTGTVPSRAQVEGRFSLQMGLLGLMAERGVLGEAAQVAAFSYWKLGGGRDPGKVTDPLVSRGKPVATPAEHIAATTAMLMELCDDYLLGSKKFTAKLHPDHAARYSDFDHLARVAEWQARP